MKRYSKKVIAMFLSLALLVVCVAVPVGAVDARSSLYLSYYRAWLTPVSGAKINVNVDVQAVSYMDNVGALSIKMYESSDGGATWDSDGTYASALYPELLVQDDYLYYDTAVVHQGTAGYKYYAVVTVYAGDSTGSDTREYQTTTVTARS